MFLQDQFLSLVAAEPACKTDAECTDPTLKICQVDAGVCVAVKDATNGACTDTTKTGFSLGLNLECLGDCPNTDTTKPVVNVKGFHAVPAAKEGDPAVCTADVAASTDPAKNNDCMPVKPSFSVNATTQMCQAACETVTKGSHNLNGICIVDTATANLACTDPKDGSS